MRALLRPSGQAAAVFVLLASAALATPPIDPLDQWGQWRGPLGTGVAPRGHPPVRWSEGENVRFKVELTGLGHSTPIVWGERVFVTTAEPYGEVEARAGHAHDHGDGAHDNMAPGQRQRFTVLALRRRDGHVLWRRTVRDERPHEGTHVTGSWASSSAVTDGQRLYAYFGSRGLYALDVTDGEVVWQQDFGDMRTRHGHGEGSSPALHGDTLVVNWDHQGDSFVIALDKHTGKTRWRQTRDEITSWSTPLVVEHGGRAQAVVAATGRTRAYDLEDGKLIWECGGLSRNVVASPVAADGRVYVGNSYDHQAMLAIRLDKAKGDITGTDAVVWSLDRHTPYVPSPLLYDGMLFFLKHSHGFLSNLDAKSGRPHYGPVRLTGGRNIFASPVGAAGRVYIASREGTVLVVERGQEFRVLALNQLDESFTASPAIAGQELYLRGRRHLYCLAQEPKRPSAQ